MGGDFFEFEMRGGGGGGGGGQSEWGNERRKAVRRERVSGGTFNTLGLKGEGGGGRGGGKRKAIGVVLPSNPGGKEKEEGL